MGRYSFKDVDSIEWVISEDITRIIVEDVLIGANCIDDVLEELAIGAWNHPRWPSRVPRVDWVSGELERYSGRDIGKLHELDVTLYRDLSNGKIWKYNSREAGDNKASKVKKKDWNLWNHYACARDLYVNGRMDYHSQRFLIVPAGSPTTEVYTVVTIAAGEARRRLKGCDNDFRIRDYWDAVRNL